MSTERVQAIINDPLGGRSEDEVRSLVASPAAASTLRHPPHGYLLERFMDHEGVDRDEALDVFEETKRFLVLGSQLGMNFAPSVPVDRFWHEWILFTDDYHTFCHPLGGFIHHTPIPKGSDDQPPLEPTIIAMTIAYGELSSRCWPVALGASGIMDCCMGPW